MQKTILITGATSGFGKACAYAYAKGGHHLILTGRRADRLEVIKKQLQDELKINVLTLVFDIRNKVEVSKAIDSLTNNWQNVDILINNAGLASGSELLQNGSLEDWETMIDTNIKGLLYITKAVIPLMLQSKHPHIVNIGSIAGKEVYAKGNVYCATKFAVDALTRAMRIDFLEYGIKVSQIAPGAAETEFSIVRMKGDLEAAANVYKGFTPLAAEDIANAVLFLASDESSYITGQTLAVTGGLVI